MNACCLRFPQRLSEFRMCPVIGLKPTDAFHLNDKNHVCFAPVSRRFHQAVKMLDAALRRRIRKSGNIGGTTKASKRL